MRTYILALLASIVLVGTLVLTEDTADACGGCFVPSEATTAVDSHRMVIAIGTEETILWDQIVYSGEPEEFVWVLPVPTPEVTIEVAESEFFDDLDRTSAPVIQPLTAPPSCPRSNSVACGGGDAALSPGGPPQDGVIVFDHSVVGPYETFTLGAEDPNALYTWLGDNGFAVAQEAVPAMEYYIGLQHEFVVMRLRPGQGVSAMQPVRVRYPGFMGTFPLRMVVVGAQGILDLSLWIFAEQRYEAANYGTVLIDQERLSWDWATGRSNYADVFDTTVEENGSRAWVVEYAGTTDSLFLPFSGDLELVEQLVPVPYLTRLRTRMLVDHIDEDMLLAPSADASDVDNLLVAPIDLNFPEDPCGTAANEGDDSLYCAMGLGSGKNAAFLGLVIVFGLIVVMRRPRRREGRAAA